jgi:hypothetical protein
MRWIGNSSITVVRNSARVTKSLLPLVRTGSKEFNPRQGSYPSPEFIRTETSERSSNDKNIGAIERKEGTEAKETADGYYELRLWAISFSKQEETTSRNHSRVGRGNEMSQRHGTEEPGSS